MRCLSKIIKSHRISMGEPIVFGTPYFQQSSGVAVNIPKANKIMEQNVVNIPNVPVRGLNLDDAKEEANNILEQAKADAIAISQSIINDEIQKGYNEGIRRAEEQYEAVLEELVLMKDKAYREYKEMLANSEKEVIEMAVMLAEKILATEIDKSNDYIIGLVQSTLEKAVNKKNIILKVSPHDYYMIQDNFKFISAKVEGFGEINIVSDDSLDKGSVIAETQFGTLDGSIATRLEQAKKVILDLMSQQ